MDYQSNIEFVIQGAVSFTDLMWLIVHSFFVTQCWFFSFVCFVIAVWDGDIPERSKTEKASEDGENGMLRFDLSSMQGWRASMEDDVTILFL